MRRGNFIWRGDVEAIAFTPTGCDGLCFVHRGALRTLTGRAIAADAALKFACANAAAFEAAAQAKIVRAHIAKGNFHLTSRDIGRHLHAAPRAADK